MPLVRISSDALARACGADELAEAFARADADVERVSSWGMHWLEPLVEIDGQGFGPVTVEDVPPILAGKQRQGHRAYRGPPVHRPAAAADLCPRGAELGRRALMTIADSGGWRGLNRARGLSESQIIEEIAASGLRGRGGAGISRGDQVAHGGRSGGRGKVRRLQCR